MQLKILFQYAFEKGGVSANEIDYNAVVGTAKSLADAMPVLAERGITTTMTGTLDGGSQVITFDNRAGQVSE